jgi:hypothetical protein
MKLIKKTNEYKTSQSIINDLKEAYNILINQSKFPTKNNKTFSITITHTNSKHLKDMRYKLTNLLFNRLNKEYKYSLDHINYLYVIEFSEVISKGEYIPNKCDIHTHIVINTSIPIKTIEYYCNDVFHGEVFIEDITKRDDKDKYINYLIKQHKIFTNDNYNYKISVY